MDETYFREIKNKITRIQEEIKDVPINEFVGIIGVLVDEYANKNKINAKDLWKELYVLGMEVNEEIEKRKGV